MREIKFRGRLKNSTKWAYGAFLAIPRLCSYIYDVQPDGQATRYLVDEDTVGQFTGLYDCEGREIYEGDVVMCGDDLVPSEVRWSPALSGFKIVKSLLLGHALKFVRVIGNKHDNPELLEVGHDRRD